MRAGTVVKPSKIEPLGLEALRSHGSSRHWMQSIIQLQHHSVPTANNAKDHGVTKHHGLNVIVPEKDSIIAPPSTPPGNDLNIAAESGSWWIDYIGPLTSDEIDSDKRWSYRDPNGNIRVVLSPARNYVDDNINISYDLQIWSYIVTTLKKLFFHHKCLIRDRNQRMPLDRFLYVCLGVSVSSSWGLIQVGADGGMGSSSNSPLVVLSEYLR
ncbi:hypothetical protein Tco_1393128 [Tanacetum coccineum]